jgi:predicted deacylase
VKDGREMSADAPGAIVLGGLRVERGKTGTVNLPISRLSTHTEMTLPVRVLHGANPGPVLFVSAGIHGDEIIGVEIIRRLLGKLSPRRLSGTLLAVPIVNVFGFLMQRRYLPDRRDLNRCFPGTEAGSLAARLANVFTREILARSNYGIDLHSAALHRYNYPQVRISPGRTAAYDMALAFGPPIIVTLPTRPGSLRQVATDRGVELLLFEAGEALRFDEFAVRVGVKGILRVMRHLGMLAGAAGGEVPRTPARSTRTHWIRAPQGGIFRAIRASGERVMAGDTLGYVSDPFGDQQVPVLARSSGVIIGRSNLPTVNQGDALVHVAEVGTIATVAERFDEIAQEVRADPLFDEDDLT